MKQILLILLFVPIFCFGQIHPYGTSTNQTYVGGKIKLNDAHDNGFGTWSSLSTGVATVGSITGTVTGVAQGSSNIVYTRTGVHDTLSIYVSTSDSSGYYFEYPIANIGQMQLRDCDGVTKLSMWSGGFYKSGTNQTSNSTVSYLTKTDTYQIIFQGITTGLGTNGVISIPYSKIKDFNGTAPYTVGRDSVLSQIQTFGF